MGWRWAAACERSGVSYEIAAMVMLCVRLRLTPGGRSVEQCSDQAAANFGIEPGRLRRHELVLFAYGDELVHRHWRQRQSKVVFPRVDARLQVGGVLVAADEVEPLVPRIADSEDGIKQIALQDVCINRPGSVARVECPRVDILLLSFRLSIAVAGVGQDALAVIELAAPIAVAGAANSD